MDNISIVSIGIYNKILYLHFHSSFSKVAMIEVLYWTHISNVLNMSNFLTCDVNNIMNTLLTILNIVPSVVLDTKRSILIVFITQTVVSSLQTRKKWSSMLDQSFYFRIWVIFVFTMWISSRMYYLQWWILFHRLLSMLRKVFW